jgi:hypothetical protein
MMSKWTEPILKESLNLGPGALGTEHSHLQCKDPPVDLTLFATRPPCTTSTSSPGSRQWQRRHAGRLRLVAMVAWPAAAAADAARGQHASRRSRPWRLPAPLQLGDSAGPGDFKLTLPRILIRGARAMDRGSMWSCQWPRPQCGLTMLERSVENHRWIRDRRRRQ